MMKVRTIQRFREKDDFSIVHEVGSEFECTDERGSYLANLGFVELVIDKPKQEKAAEPEKAEAKPKDKKKKTYVDDEGDKYDYKK